MNQQIETLKKELENYENPIPCLIMINEIWWGKHHNINEQKIFKEIDIEENIKNKAKQLYEHLNLNNIKEEEQWIDYIAKVSIEFLEKEKTKQKNNNWKPLDL